MTSPHDEDFAAPAAHERSDSTWRNPWFQLVVGIVAMVAIANLQYGWTLFVDPLDHKNHWGREAIQWAFTLFVLAETWLLPVEGYLVDRFGPRPLLAAGGVLVGLAWVLNSRADTLWILYAGALVGGVGAGIVYGTSVGNALKWFPGRRGLAAGLTAAAFGAGSALTVVPISKTIKSAGYEHAFFWFGLAQGGIVLACSLFTSAPGPGKLTQAGQKGGSGAARDVTWLEMVRTPIFWLMYAMFVMVAVGGLMATAQLGPIAHDYNVAAQPLHFLGLVQEALPLALALDRVLNGISRPLFGWVSDQIGRENTLFLAFTLEGIAIVLLVFFVQDPVLFVLVSGLTFFAWGEIYSLFPALCADTFGRRYATTNYGFLYTAKGTASLLVPLGNLLKKATGSWVPILLVAIVFNFAAAILALWVLKPMRRRWQSESASQEPFR
ncbi:MAG TPA: oxalate/formate MFS antiporter [Isosphaeraceae bacterium]|nr:oxalate/formate MFS antiporter [Isosphaeraceae bacterium]